MLAPNNLLLDEARPFEHQDVFRDRVERNREGPGNLGDRSRLSLQCGENSPARRVRDCRKHAVENLDAIFNHSVEYKLGRDECQA